MSTASEPIAGTSAPLAPQPPVAKAGRNWLSIGTFGVFAIILIVLPQVLNAFWTGRVTGWIPIAIAALGLNLLTGYNGQISVGHGALYGLGAYATALVINEWAWSFPLAIVFSAIVCFGAGVLIGLPALRIKGLYLALVTLAVATLFPQVLEQFSDTTGGSTGLGVTSPELYRGRIRDRSIKFEAPEWTGLASDQWRYYFFLVVAAICFLLVRNIVNSRAGRSIIAIRDNETAAEVSGVNVARAKVFTFGLSSALAGVGGSLLALYLARVSSGSFTLTTSLYFLVAVVIGGAQSIAGPAIGAVFIGVFNDVITPDLPEAWKPASPLILGALLIILMLVAPGGVAGLIRQFTGRMRTRKLVNSAINNPSSGGTT